MTELTPRFTLYSFVLSDKVYYFRDSHRPHELAVLPESILRAYRHKSTSMRYDDIIQMLKEDGLSMIYVDKNYED